MYWYFTLNIIHRSVKTRCSILTEVLNINLCKQLWSLYVQYLTQTICTYCDFIHKQSLLLALRLEDIDLVMNLWIYFEDGEETDKMWQISWYSTIVINNFLIQSFGLFSCAVKLELWFTKYKLVTSMDSSIHCVGWN